MTDTPKSHLCRHRNDAIHYREADVVRDLMGHQSFSQVMIAHILGRPARPADVAIVDAVMIAVMEHGLTPSAIAARMVYMSSPENLQSGVAAGLLAVGSQFVGTMENAAVLIDRVLAGEDPEAIARDFRSRKAALPGFGHHLHKPDDPRAMRLMEFALEQDTPGHHVAAIKRLSAAIDDVYGRHITINATGASAAALGEIGIPIRIMRGFALISRCAGLVAHLAEEQQEPTGRFLWDLADNALSHD